MSNMENIDYANAYKEVSVIINKLNKNDYSKIPEGYINFFNENSNKEYNFIYDATKDFKSQNISDTAKYILFYLFEMYGASDTQKEKIKSYRVNYYNKKEQEKIDKYNPDNIFKDTNTYKINNDKQLIEYKDSLFNKIINKLKNLFKS